MATKLLGRQQPRVLTRPEFASEARARRAIQRAKVCRSDLMTWQRTCVRTTLATNADGVLAATQVGILVSRQNGKGEVLLAIGLDSLFELMGLTLWTAHEWKTCEDAYRRMCVALRADPDLAERVTRWDGGGAGEHMIETDGGPDAGGARIHFIARSKSSGRGFPARRIIFDEAQQLPVLSYRALTFSTAAQAERQLVFVGTVPDETMDGEVWTSIRDRGRKGAGKRFAWLEWSPPHSDDPRVTINPDDRRNWQWACPSLGRLIAADTVEDELEGSTADTDGFLRERLSVWPNVEAGTGLIDLDKWDNCGASGLLPWAGAIGLVVDLTQDRKHSLMGVVGSAEDGLPQVELLSPTRKGNPEPGKGTSWVPARTAEVAADNPDISEIVIDGKAQAKALVPAIRAALDQRWAAMREDAEARGEDVRPQPEIRMVNGSEYVTGCGLTFDAIDQQAIHHGGGPVMRAAMRAAVKRDLDGVWVWDRRRGGVVMAPLVLLTLGVSVMGIDGDDYDPADGIAF